MKHEDKNHHGAAPWWSQSMVVRWKLVFWRVVLNALKGGSLTGFEGKLLLWS
jgi:hypothetical protein